jgi:hypothetical protein
MYIVMGLLGYSCEERNPIKKIDSSSLQLLLYNSLIIKSIDFTKNLKK